MHPKQVSFSTGKLANAVNLHPRQIARYAAGEYGEKNRPPGAIKADGYHWSFSGTEKEFQTWIAKMNSHQKGNGRWHPETRALRRSPIAMKASGKGSGGLGYIESIAMHFHQWERKNGSSLEEWTPEQCQRWIECLAPLMEFHNKVKRRILASKSTTSP